MGQSQWQKGYLGKPPEEKYFPFPTRRSCIRMGRGSRGWGHPNKQDHTRCGAALTALGISARIPFLNSDGEFGEPRIVKKPNSLVLIYIYLALGSATLGALITFVMVALVQYFHVDFWENLWLLAIPLVLSVTLNVIFIELYLKRKRK